MLKDKVLSLIEERDMIGLKSLLKESEEMEILQAFYDLSPDEQVIVFRLLSKSDALTLFEELDTEEQQNLLKSFTAEKTIEFVNEMAPDDRVRLLDELPALVAKKLLNSLSPAERAVTNALMGYAPETAGRVMTTEYISLKRNMTVEQALEKISLQAEDKETVYTLFITDSKRKLEGVLTLKGLLIARGATANTIGKTDGNTLVGDIMSKNAISVTTDTDQEEVAKILKELDLLAIPVVDREERLVGIVTIDDAIDILEEEATEDIYDQAGLLDITGNEADRSDVLVNGKIFAIWKIRLPILIVTLVFGFLSGFIIEDFESRLESIALVAIFIPLVMGMSGDVGTQSSTVFARGIVLGQIKVQNFVKHFLKEILVGFTMGIVLGAATGIVTVVIWQVPMLGLAVGLSLALTMTIAALLGFFVPYFLIRLNLDQAAGSAPIITSIKDILGLVIYFVLITIFMGNMM